MRKLLSCIKCKPTNPFFIGKGELIVGSQTFSTANYLRLKTDRVAGKKQATFLVFCSIFLPCSERDVFW